MYAPQLLNQVSDLTDDEELMEVVHAYFKEVRDRRLRGVLDRWGSTGIYIYSGIPGSCGVLLLRSKQDLLVL